MPRSARSGGATPDQSKPQGPPSSRCGGYHGDAPCDNAAGPGAAPLKRGGSRPNSPMSELGTLMQEPAGGPNHGRRASTNPEAEGRDMPLSADDWQAAEFMRDGGWTVAREKDPALAGMAAHRGVLHPDEYVDEAALRGLVERELGFSYEQVRSVYRQGPLSADMRELRGQIDARVLALSRAGANVALLGAALGFPVKDNGNCRAMENALSRARAEEVTS